MSGTEQTRRASKVCAFFGHDVKAGGASLLRRFARRGFALLALDARAMGFASRARVPFALLDDWLDPASLRAARATGARLEKEWFRARRAAFETHGICWPELDHHAMHWFWADVAAAEALARRFRESGVTDLRFVQRRARRPLLYYSAPNDVAAAVWAARLPGVARPFEPAAFARRGWDDEASRTDRPDEVADPDAWTRRARRALARPERALRGLLRSRRGRAGAAEPPPARAPRPAATPEDLRGRIVLAVNAHEAHRLSPAVAELCARFPDGVAAAPLFDDPDHGRTLAAAWELPALAGPPAGEPEAATAARFREALEEARASAADPIAALALDALGFHFAYFGGERWPRLDAAYRYWLDAWERARPRAVLVSSLEDAESQLPAAAARRLGIPSLALPHGAVQWIDARALPSEYILYSLAMQRPMLLEAGAEESRLLACRDLVPASEYPSAARAPGGRGGALRILALTNPTTHAGTLCARISAKAQIEGLRAACEPPAELAGKVEVHVKPHPHQPESGLLRAAGPAVVRRVLPTDADLPSALGETDLVVALNYSGSALAHVVDAAVPLIFFWPDETIGENDWLAHERAFLEAGELVRDAGTLWARIRALAEAPAALAGLRDRVAAFRALGEERCAYPELGEVVSGVVARASTQPAPRPKPDPS